MHHGDHPWELSTGQSASQTIERTLHPPRVFYSSQHGSPYPLCLCELCTVERPLSLHTPLRGLLVPLVNLCRWWPSSDLALEWAMAFRKQNVVMTGGPRSTYLSLPIRDQVLQVLLAFGYIYACKAHGVKIIKSLTLQQQQPFLTVSHSLSQSDWNIDYHSRAPICLLFYF